MLPNAVVVAIVLAVAIALSLAIAVGAAPNNERSKAIDTLSPALNTGNNVFASTLELDSAKNELVYKLKEPELSNTVFVDTPEAASALEFARNDSGDSIDFAEYARFPDASTEDNGLRMINQVLGFVALSRNIAPESPFSPFSAPIDYDYLLDIVAEMNTYTAENAFAQDVLVEDFFDCLERTGDNFKFCNPLEKASCGALVTAVSRNENGVVNLAPCFLVFLFRNLGISDEEFLDAALYTFEFRNRDIGERCKVVDTIGSMIRQNLLGAILLSNAVTNEGEPSWVGMVAMRPNVGNYFQSEVYEWNAELKMFVNMNDFWRERIDQLQPETIQTWWGTIETQNIAPVDMESEYVKITSQ
tara:strand:+ start:3855 stop:4931 length:1077 start_codon:yes stop_codon:yes gene_type:complete